ncbi:hypothetical protein H4R26_000155 [Coemansia thaxteri]|uniref:Uncharacterized protein n=1 Tax=Coemansia thaxteri TaxID=2663907 RepID=A0A9W8BJ94_9FUNG|nr:hypothetical protein H4R26_000155 [Coemansia thaxteri]KAJ2488219.1 hypothetical protein EV174_000025 [Coemansia sp. RSA 2320]
MAQTNALLVYQQNLDKFSTNEPAQIAGELFGPPDFMGHTLDSLTSTRAPDFAAQMPGIVMGQPASNVNASDETRGEINIQPVAGDEQQPARYYLAYGPDQGKIVWFQVQITQGDNEVLVAHGVKDF